MKPVLYLHFVCSTTNAKKWIASLPLEFLTLKINLKRLLLTFLSRDKHERGPCCLIAVEIPVRKCWEDFAPRFHPMRKMTRF